MRKIVKWLGVALGVLALVLAGVVGAAWINSERAFAKRYVVNDAALVIPRDAQALAHGQHLFDTRGCGDCHGERGAGKLVMDAGPLMKLVAPNITPPVLAARGYDADDIAAAIRHAVRPDGTPLIFMPSRDWTGMSDTDTASLIAYLQTLPASSADPGKSEVRVLARVLHLFGKFPLVPAEKIDHAPRARSMPAPQATVEFGSYIAQTCTGCHGPALAGGPPLAPGTPPVANLTTLQSWTQADFLRAMREGTRPDGSRIDPFMPWKTVGRMTDTELAALLLYLQSLPPAQSHS